MKKDKPCMTYEEKYLISELEQVNSAQKRYKFLLERAKEANLTIKCEIINRGSTL